MKTAILSVSSALVVISSGFGAGPGDKAAAPSPEMAAVQTGDRAYEEAYAKGDVPTLLSFYTEDAEYTSDTGRTFSGRAALEACLKDAFRANKGAKLAITTDTVKSIAPEVVAQKGSTVVTSANGETVEALFTAVYVKKDGKWKISQLVETPLPEVTPTERLSELAWLVGSWEEADKESGLTVRSTYQWARGGAFITRNVTVKRGADPVLEGWQIIGWDPVAGNIRSWTFDDEGGYSEGAWTRDGQRWLVRDQGYAADGSRTSSDQTITKVNDGSFIWESGNRTLDGEPMPSIGRIEINRTKGE